MIDVLVVSQSCLTAINRVPFRLLRDLGWNVELVVPTRFRAAGFDRPADPRTSEDPPIHFLPIRSSHPRLWTYDGLDELLDQRRPRILYTDVDPGSRLALQLGWWAKRNGGRLACLSCDNMPRTLRGELKRSPGSAARFLVTRALGTAARGVVDHVFAISHDIEAVMKTVGFGDRVSVIPLGFDPKLFRPDPAARRRVRESLGLRETTVAYFGRLIPEKGVHHLIDALAELKNERWQMMIDEFKEYDHPYVRQIREQIGRVGLADRIVYFDARHDEMPMFMNAADIVVVPSESNPAWKEQYGRVAPEAMACGRMVITSNCGALPELVGEAGVVVPEGSVGALRDAIAQALANPTLRDSMGHAAFERAHAELSVTQQVEGMHEIFSRWARPTAVARRMEAQGASV